MEFQDITYEERNGYGILTLNRPSTLNALRMQMKHEIEKVIDYITEADNIFGLIITGSGRAFMAGSDISELQGERSAAETETFSLNGQALMNKLEEMGKPVIAAVNGYAMGGGMELALACDLRVAGEKAVFGLPEVDLGVTPCYGGTQRLPRLVGAGVAKDILFTARKVRADEALKIGLVNRLVNQDKLMEETEALMQTILKNAPIAIKYSKYLVDKGLEMSLTDGLKYEAHLNGLLAETEDAKEGMHAFQEKRKPVFKNK